MERVNWLEPNFPENKRQENLSELPDTRRRGAKEVGWDWERAGDDGLRTDSNTSVKAGWGLMGLNVKWLIYDPDLSFQFFFFQILVYKN